MNYPAALEKKYRRPGSNKRGCEPRLVVPIGGTSRHGGAEGSTRIELLYFSLSLNGERFNLTALLVFMIIPRVGGATSGSPPRKGSHMNPFRLSLCDTFVPH